MARKVNEISISLENLQERIYQNLGVKKKYDVIQGEISHLNQNLLLLHIPYKLESIYGTGAYQVEKLPEKQI
jgi:hypothetical protein